jgi:hypothetical protein
MAIDHFVAAVRMFIRRALIAVLRKLKSGTIACQEKQYYFLVFVHNGAKVCSSFVMEK